MTETATRVRKANTGSIKTVIKPIATRRPRARQRLWQRQPADLQLRLLLTVLPRPGVPAIDIGREEEQLQKQAGVELDLEEDDRKQRDVYQPERIVTDLLKAGQPDTGKPASVPTASIHDRS